jgi:hypothetical protein
MEIQKWISLNSLPLTTLPKLSAHSMTAFFSTCYSAPLEINGRQALAAPSGQQRVVYREIDNLNNPYQNGPDYIALGVVGDDYPVKSHREYFPALAGCVARYLAA